MDRDPDRNPRRQLPPPICGSGELDCSRSPNGRQVRLSGYQGNPYIF